jgi:hypothetical protein
LEASFIFNVQALQTLFSAPIVTLHCVQVFPVEGLFTGFFSAFGGTLSCPVASGAGGLIPELTETLEEDTGGSAINTVGDPQ